MNLTNEQLIIVCIGAIFAILAWRGRRDQFFEALFVLLVVLFVDCDEHGNNVTFRKEPRWFLHSESK